MTTRAPGDNSEAPRDGARGVGFTSDLRRLRTDGAAGLAELRQFLGTLHGRKPQEVLGLVAANELVRSTAVAAVGCVVLTAVLTIVPYALSGGQSQKPTAAAPPAATEPTPGTDESAAAPPAAAVGPAVPGASDLEAAAAALDLEDAAPADPDVNPRESDLDRLLDGID